MDHDQESRKAIKAGFKELGSLNFLRHKLTLPKESQKVSILESCDRFLVSTAHLFIFIAIQ